MERKEERRVRAGTSPGSPVAKTSLSNAEGPGLIPGGGAKILHASWPKNQNRNNIVTNSIKTFKIVHIKKNLREKKKGGFSL